MHAQRPTAFAAERHPGARGHGTRFRDMASRPPCVRQPRCLRQRHFMRVSRVSARLLPTVARFVACFFSCPGAPPLPPPLPAAPASDGRRQHISVGVRVPRACAGSGSSLALCLPLTPLLVDEVVVDVWERGSHELPSQHGGISERATTASGCCRGSAAPAEHIW